MPDIMNETRNCSFTSYLLEKQAPVVVICPGGGYKRRSLRESKPVADAFNGAGFHAVVVNYCLEQEELGDSPLLDLAWAVSYLRQHAKEFRIEPDQIFVCGFSAGGHLAGSLGVFWNDERRFPDKEQRELQKPNGLILNYPVISAGEFAHKGSFLRLSSNEKIQQTYSLEKYVSSAVPPCFIWHTATDASVPVENSLLFASQLMKYGVSCEMMIFPNGPHGMSLATEAAADEEHMDVIDPHVARWFTQCVDWMEKIVLKK